MNVNATLIHLVQGLRNTMSLLIFSSIDIDECTESTSGCDQICTNSAGSFKCSCISGYTLDSNNKTCTGKHAMQILLR